MNDDLEIGNEVNEGVFEQGWYAVYEIPHTVQAVQQAWRWVIPKTLEAGYRICAFTHNLAGIWNHILATTFLESQLYSHYLLFPIIKIES